jgi:hypothetical protein
VPGAEPLAAQRDDRVADGQLPEAARLVRVALEHDQGGGPEVGELGAERVDEPRGRLVGRQQPPHAAEPVEDDEARAVAAGGRDDRVLGLLRAARQQVGQARELDELGEEAGVEEGEVAVVADQLLVGLRVPGQVEDRLGAAGEGERDLLGEDGLAGAGRPDHHRHRAAAQSAAERPVEVRHPRLHRLGDVAARPAPALSVGHVRSPSVRRTGGPPIRE